MLFFYLFITCIGTFLGGCAVLCIQQKHLARFVSLGASLLVLASTLFLIPYAAVKPLELTFEWIPQFGVSFTFMVDGISLPLILLTTISIPVLLLAAKRFQVDSRVTLAALLCLEGSILGALMARDLLLFYLFWELMLVPMVVLLLSSVDYQRKNSESRSTAKLFFIYTVCGAVCMFGSIVYLGIQHFYQFGSLTFDARALALLQLSMSEQVVLFGAFLIACSVKLPLFPLHTWLPRVQTVGSTVAASIFGGILFSMGIYGIIRFAIPLAPEGFLATRPVLMLLGAFAVVYGALVAWRREDFRELLAYSTVSHLGLCVVGIAVGSVDGLTAVLFHCVAHGFSALGLFLLTGVLECKTGTHQLGSVRGLKLHAPWLACVYIVLLLGYIAVPLSNGFVGEFVILYEVSRQSLFVAMISLSGAVFGAVYMLHAYQLQMHGESQLAVQQGDNRDLSSVEWRIFFVPILATVLLGIFPLPLLRIIQPTVKGVFSPITSRIQRTAAQYDSLSKAKLSENSDVFLPSNPIQSGYTSWSPYDYTMNI